MNNIKLSAFILLSLFFTVSFAEVYKWTDDSGRMNYTQYKPLHHESELVDGPPPAASGSQDLNKPFAEQIDQRGKARREQLAAEKAKSSKTDFNAQQCDTATKNLSALQAGGRVSFVSSTGETIYMSDDDKKLRIGEAKKQIEFYCQ